MSVQIKSFRERDSSTPILSSASTSRSGTWIVTWYPFDTHAPLKRAGAQGAGSKGPEVPSQETWEDEGHLGGFVRGWPEDVRPQFVTSDCAFGGGLNGSTVLCRNAPSSAPVTHNRGALTDGLR